MKQSYVFDTERMELVPKDEYYARQAPVNQAFMVMPDIQPYRSMINGEVINSRSVHRSHLKAHNCIEVGNETKYLTKPKPVTPPPGLKETLIRVVNDKLRS